MKNIQNLNYDNLSNSLNNTARTRCRITKLDSRNFYSTNNSNISRDEWPVILGRKGDLLPAYRIANEYLNKGKHITAVEVNKVLAFSGIKITQDTLDKILSGPRLEFSNLDSDTIRSDNFLQTVGTVRGKIQVPGVYI
jgi:hypothetical protein